MFCLVSFILVPFSWKCQGTHLWCISHQTQDVKAGGPKCSESPHLGWEESGREGWWVSPWGSSGDWTLSSTEETLPSWSADPCPGDGLLTLCYSDALCRDHPSVLQVTSGPGIENATLRTHMTSQVPHEDEQAGWSGRPGPGNRQPGRFFQLFRRPCPLLPPSGVGGWGQSRPSSLHPARAGGWLPP